MMLLSLEHYRIASASREKLNYLVQESLIEDKIAETCEQELEVAEVQASSTKEPGARALYQSLQVHRSRLEQDYQMSGLSSMFADSNRLKKNIMANL